jgi:hypothetical protein
LAPTSTRVHKVSSFCRHFAALTLDEQLMRVIAVIRLFVQMAAIVLILVAVPTDEIDEIDEMRCSVRNTLFQINFI